ncbi:hypothetical protein GCM10010176_046160 [Nonomuraea spiralis]|nr:hypothetical protein GCM10010176_046160 [Nonomuraea spiralis]
MLCSAIIFHLLKSSRKAYQWTYVPKPGCGLRKVLGSSKVSMRNSNPSKICQLLCLAGLRCSNSKSLRAIDISCAFSGAREFGKRESLLRINSLAV